jgi:hypothetical protein
VLVGVPIGGAATVCAWTPHIGAAANALCAQASDNTNADQVHSRTNQTCREFVAESIALESLESFLPGVRRAVYPDDLVAQPAALGRHSESP